MRLIALRWESEVVGIEIFNNFNSSVYALEHSIKLTQGKMVNVLRKTFKLLDQLPIELQSDLLPPFDVVQPFIVYTVPLLFIYSYLQRKDSYTSINLLSLTKYSLYVYFLTLQSSFH
jgi:hypothetical protein